MTISFHADNIIPTGDWVFVFGSNEGGKHAKEQARIAHVNFRAEYGCGRGPTGQAFAIPTKDKHFVSLPLSQVKVSIAEFLEYARSNLAKHFFVTRVGCGPTGYADDQIGPLFKEAPANCSLPDAWQQFVVQKDKHTVAELV